MAELSAKSDNKKKSEKVRKLRSDASHVNLCFPQNYLRILSDLFLKTLVNFMTLELLIIVLSIHRVTSVMEVLSSPTDHFSWTNRKLRFDQENDVKIIATNGEEEVHHLFFFRGLVEAVIWFSKLVKKCKRDKKSSRISSKISLDSLTFCSIFC